MILSVDSSYSHYMMEVDNESSFSSISSENILTPGERLQWLNHEVQMIDRLIDFAIVILENANDKDIQSRWDATIFDPASNIRITAGFKILTTTGIFPELFAHMPSHVVHNHTLQGYTILMWEKFMPFRNAQEPVWIELAGYLLTFVLSNNADALNKWLFSDILINEHISRNFKGFAFIFCENINDAIVKDVICGVIDYLSFKRNSEQILSFLNDFTSASYFLNQL
ncbi:DNA-dependent protein kinase catalytic subunit [Gigaspora margarita]|uniref:DNA-dependent protein kinase catalytic subunit n=1 Tax=Gigaspora margarita TaxID=4874 RepID=A0A8H4B0T3_GIGMA|nr:DNA-dependent protein kinase catalytic subunit [Gigaspora margarita]